MSFIQKSDKHIFAYHFIYIYILSRYIFFKGERGPKLCYTTLGLTFG